MAAIEVQWRNRAVGAKPEIVADKGRVIRDIRRGGHVGPMNHWDSVQWKLREIQPFATLAIRSLDISSKIGKGHTAPFRDIRSGLRSKSAVLTDAYRHGFILEGASKVVRCQKSTGSRFSDVTREYRGRRGVNEGPDNFARRGDHPRQLSSRKLGRGRYSQRRHVVSGHLVTSLFVLQYVRRDLVE